MPSSSQNAPDAGPHVTIADIASALESWAPTGLAQGYDNVGLQIGRSSRKVSRVLVALDCTPAVVAEARSLGAELVVSHHPLLFRPLKTLTDRGLVASTTLELAESGIALYSIHTNLDAARGGVSFALADQIGLKDVGFLQPLEERPLRKLVVYTPSSRAEEVRRAMGSAGAGRIGDYDDCAFEVSGTGYFRPGLSTSPNIGTAGGDLEKVDEIRVEAEVLSWNIARVLSAVRAVHPYEEIAYDVIPVEQPFRDAGIGAVGNLPAPMVLRDFLTRVSEALHARGLRFSADPQRLVSRVAVCGGSGSDFIPAALASGADAYVTSDVTYHRWFDALAADGNPRIALVDAGHYETEAITEKLLVDRLSRLFPGVDWIRTSVRTSPVSVFPGGVPHVS